MKMMISNQKHLTESEREKAIGRITLELEKRDAIAKDKLVSVFFVLMSHVCVMSMCLFVAIFGSSYAGSIAYWQIA